MGFPSVRTYRVFITNLKDKVIARYNRKKMVKWIQLENFKCPSCPSAGGKNWVCAKDQDPVFLNEKGIMECLHGAHTGQVISWSWNCGSSYHNGQFLRADLEGFTFALSQAVQLMSKGGSEWVASLITELGKQYGA